MQSYTGIDKGQTCKVAFCGYHQGGGRHRFEGGLPDCVLVVVICRTIFPNLSLEETSCTTVPCYVVVHSQADHRKGRACNASDRKINGTK